MTSTNYEKVCYRTEQRDEKVALRNVNNGEVGYTFGCTLAGETVQVKLPDGGLDSWVLTECTEVVSEPRVS